MAVSTTTQTMLWLAFAADSDAKNHYVNDCDTAKQLAGLIQGRLDTLNSQTKASWKMVWGPAIYSFPINYKGRHIDNAVYVVRNGTTSDYAIAIAGTDAYSLADWVLEDFLVATTIPWFLELFYHPRPRISLATFNGLTILLNITPPCTLPGNGHTLISFLRGVGKNGPFNLYTTGHSLGGALAPTLTLALDDLKWKWDLPGHVTFLPYAFAGPTPGDAALAGYFQEKFPGGLQRFWNSLDIVPHAWDTPHMEELPTIYGQSVPAVADMVKGILDVISPIGYTPLNGEPAAFTGQQQNPNITTIEQYLAEAAYQHTTAYSIWSGINDWSTPKMVI